MRRGGRNGPPPPPGSSTISISTAGLRAGNPAMGRWTAALFLFSYCARPVAAIDCVYRRGDGTRGAGRRLDGGDAYGRGAADAGAGGGRRCPGIGRPDDSAGGGDGRGRRRARTHRADLQHGFDVRPLSPGCRRRAAWLGKHRRAFFLARCGRPTTGRGDRAPARRGRADAGGRAPAPDRAGVGRRQPGDARTGQRRADGAGTRARDDGAGPGRGHRGRGHVPRHLLQPDGRAGPRRAGGRRRGRGPARTHRPGRGAADPPRRACDADGAGAPAAPRAGRAARLRSHLARPGRARSRHGRPADLASSRRARFMYAPDWGALVPGADIDADSVIDPAPAAGANSPARSPSARPSRWPRPRPWPSSPCVGWARRRGRDTPRPPRPTRGPPPPPRRPSRRRRPRRPCCCACRRSRASRCATTGRGSPTAWRGARAARYRSRSTAARSSRPATTSCAGRGAHARTCSWPRTT